MRPSESEPRLLVGTSPDIDILSDNYPSFPTLGVPPHLISFYSSHESTVDDESVPNISDKSPTEQEGNNDPFVDRGIPKTTFAAASPVTRPLVPVDWQDRSEPACFFLLFFL